MLPISPAWRNAASQLIEEGGTLEDADHFAGKVFRKQFFPLIALVYWEELLTVTKTDIVDAGERLKVDPATVLRWVTKSNPAAADKFFAVVLLLLKRDLNSIPFPNQNTLLFRCVRQQIERFAEEICEEKTTCQFDKTVFRGLMHAMSDASSDHLVPGEGKNLAIVSTQLKTSLRRVNEGLKLDFDASLGKGLTAFSKPPIVEPERLHAWYVSWGMPYTLFAMGTEDAQWGLEDA